MNELNRGPRDCYACKRPSDGLYETRFGRLLELCDGCRDRLDLGPLLKGVKKLGGGFNGSVKVVR